MKPCPNYNAYNNYCWVCPATETSKCENAKKILETISKKGSKSKNKQDTDTKKKKFRWFIWW